MCLHLNVIPASNAFSTNLSTRKPVCVHTRETSSVNKLHPSTQQFFQDSSSLEIITFNHHRLYASSSLELFFVESFFVESHSPRIFPQRRSLEVFGSLAKMLGRGIVVSTKNGRVWSRRVTERSRLGALLVTHCEPWFDHARSEPDVTERTRRPGQIRSDE